MEKARFNFTLPVDVKQWLENESKSTGISQATLVLIALKTYMDQQNMMKMASQIDVLQSYVNACNNTSKSDL